MSSSITLSSAVRSNLLSLQKTADLLGKTQEKLATGLKVNSALDDPTAFFTASSLNSRASDLNRLQDFVGNAVQTLKAADEGISAINNLVEAAEATARQALQTAAPTTTAVSYTGASAIASDTAPTVTGGSLGSDIELDATGAGFTAGDTIEITLNGTTSIINFEAAGDGNAATADSGNNYYINLDDANGSTAGNGDATVDTLRAKIASISGLSSTFSSNKLTIASASHVGDLTITVKDGGTGSSTLSSALGFTGSTSGTTVVEPGNTDLNGLTGTLTLKIGSGTANTISFGTSDSSGQVNNRTELLAAINGISGITASYDSNKLKLVLSDATQSLTIGGGTAELDALNVTAGRQDPTVATSVAARSAFATQFNELRTQIDQLAKDAGFNGVNLLDGDSLTVTFNEDGTSSLGISGVTFDSAGLGITSADNSFQLDVNINDSITELKAATNTLRSQASKFGSNLSVVETRQEFTKNLINVLETGAANLTLADTNEEGANLLALQTRQQLSSTALSLASQADQNVLRLF